MSNHALRLEHVRRLGASRASSVALRKLNAISDLRKRAEIAVVERLNLSIPIENLPLAILATVLASLIAARRQ